MMEEEVITKFYQFRSRLETRNFFFSQRITDVWNQLPEEAVAAPSTNVFKLHVDKFLRKVWGHKQILVDYIKQVDVCYPPPSFHDLPRGISIPNTSSISYF